MMRSLGLTMVHSLDHLVEPRLPGRGWFGQVKTTFLGLPVHVQDWFPESHPYIHESKACRCRLAISTNVSKNKFERTGTGIPIRVSESTSHKPKHTQTQSIYTIKHHKSQKPTQKETSSCHPLGEKTVIAQTEDRKRQPLHNNAQPHQRSATCTGKPRCDLKA